MNNSRQVPFLDLVTPHVQLEEELLGIFRSALRSAQFIGGPSLEKFERDFAAFCGSKYSTGVNSGTDALRFGLIAAGVQKGDTVLTVPNTFIATTEAISQAGAIIDFVDIDEQTYNMDPEKLQEYLEQNCAVDNSLRRPVSKRTGSIVSAVIPVHLYGQMADMDRIVTLANEFNLAVVEDACQAHGAEYFSQIDRCWKKAGSIGIAAAFSFYPGKNLGACGEGGAITTNDADISRKVSMLRDHGQVQKYYHDIEGYNGRLDAIQAGILDAKLEYLPVWNENRRMSAHRYNCLLKHLDNLVLPQESRLSKAVYHLYVIRSKRRDDLRQFLADNLVNTGLHYPVPLHRQKAYGHMGYGVGSFPVTEKVCKEILSLPIYPGLLEEQQEYVAEKIEEFLKDI